MRTLSLLVVLFLIACSPPPPVRDPVALGPMSTPAVNAKWQMTPAGGFVAAGDTLDYTLLCTPPNTRITGSRWNTTVTGTGWTGMLVNAITALPCSIPFKPINTAGWTTATFTACVRGTRGTDSTSTAGCVSWTVVRGLGPMTPPGVDSSRIITALFVYPEATTIQVSTNKQFCAYFGALDGLIRMMAGQESNPDCMAYYDQLPVALRPPGYTTALEDHPGHYLPEQIIVDARGIPHWRDEPNRMPAPLPVEKKYELARMLFASR